MVDRFYSRQKFPDDMEFIFSKMGVTDNDFAHHEHESSGDSTTELALKLYAKVPKKLKQQLYDLYKIDFEMFEYDPKPFL